MNKEESVLQAVIAGKDGAFASLYSLYVDELYSYGKHFNFDEEVVKDAIQDVFCYIYSHPEKLKDVINLKYYLFRSLKNKILDHYKSKRTVSLNETDTMPEFQIEMSAEESFIDHEEKANITEKIQQMFSTLSSQQREAIYLRYFQEMEYHDIAELLNSSEVVVRKSVSRGIEKMKKNNVIPSIIFILLWLETESEIFTHNI